MTNSSQSQSAADLSSDGWSIDEIARVRADTPATNHIIHFNNAGSSLVPEPVHQTVIGYLARERQIGGYETAAERSGQIGAAHATLATLIGANANEIAIMDSATRAWIAVFGAMRFAPGDRILTTTSEYASNYIAYLQAQKRYGVTIDVIPDDESGALSVAALESMITSDVKLIAINHIPTHDGVVNPASVIGKIARAANVPFLLDACQSVGQMAIDVEEIGCVMLTATGRKYLRGPRGTGFLYIRESFAAELEPWMLDLHSADWPSPESYDIKPGAQRFELWEFDHAARLGLTEAARYAMSWGLKKIENRVQALAAYLRAQLGAINGVIVRDRGAIQCGIVTFTINGCDPFDLQRELRVEGIHVSVSKARSARIDFARRDHDARLRASIHYYNTIEEIDLFVARIERCTTDDQA